MISFKTVTIVLVASLVRSIECGECCQGHYDALGNWKAEQWCDTYCCFQLYKYDCCDNILLRAPEDEIDDFCSDWFSKHVWGPILIAILGVASIIGCCVCCYKCCCASSRVSGVIVQPGGTGGGVTVVNSQQTMQQSLQTMPPAPQPQAVYNPYSAGYDNSGYGQPPAYGQK